MNKIIRFSGIMIIFLLVLSCKKENVTTNKTQLLSENKMKLSKDSIINFRMNIKDKSIFNDTDKQIDVLINGEREYLGNDNKTNFKFNTECLKCQAIEVYGNDLLFAKQLLISENQIRYFKKPIVISKKLKQIETESSYEQKTSKFKFKEGVGKIKFEKVACNDSDKNEVTLNYGKRKIIIRNFVEANFFEFDLDKNGTKEQYIFGVRNCSQEIVILRIRETLNKKTAYNSGLRQLIVESKI